MYDDHTPLILRTNFHQEHKIFTIILGHTKLPLQIPTMVRQKLVFMSTFLKMLSEPNFQAFSLKFSMYDDHTPLILRTKFHQKHKIFTIILGHTKLPLQIPTMVRQKLVFYVYIFENALRATVFKRLA
jgi:hypothetical protein